MRWIRVRGEHELRRDSVSQRRQRQVVFVRRHELRHVHPRRRNVLLRRNKLERFSFDTFQG